MSGSGCEDVIDRLIAALRKGGDISVEDRQHVASCSECNRLLAAAGRLEDELEADVRGNGGEERISRATREAQAALKVERWRRAAFTVLGGLAMLIPWLMVPKLTILQVLGVLVGLGAIGTLLGQRLNAGTGSVKLYKRLKGQWVFGVCRGLAEAAGLPVAVLRVPFIALMFIGKAGVAIGLLLYLLLEMSLEVHPEDRGLLLRFRVKRWLDRIFAPSRRGSAADGTAPHEGA